MSQEDIYDHFYGPSSNSSDYGAAMQAAIGMLHFVEEFTTQEERAGCTDMKEAINLIATNLINANTNSAAEQLAINWQDTDNVTKDRVIERMPMIFLSSINNLFNDFIRSE